MRQPLSWAQSTTLRGQAAPEAPPGRARGLIRVDRQRDVQPVVGTVDGAQDVMATSRQHLWIAPLLVLGLAHSQGGAPLQRQAREASAPLFLPTEVEEIWRHPSRYVGKQVTLVLQVHSEPESWNPYLTRFTPGAYACVRGWSDTQRPWIEDEFRAPRARVFARRGSASAWALEGAERYKRYELNCEVVAVFGDTPWLEVVGVKPLVRQLGDGAVLHAQRAVQLMGKALWEGATVELDRALQGALPEPAREELTRLRDVCAEQLAKVPPITPPFTPPAQR